MAAQFRYDMQNPMDGLGLGRSGSSGPSRLVMALALILLLAGCTLQPPKAVFQGDATAYNQFLTPTPLVPFLSRGTLFMQIGDQKESGEYTLAGTDNRHLRIQLRARVTGSLAMELQMADEQLLFLDHLKHTYFEGPNTRANRLRLFHSDMSAADFLLLLTGRFPREEFEAGKGTISKGGYAELTLGESHYSFTLDSHGLVQRWAKGQKAKVIYRVEYGPYLAVPTNKGQILRVPHRVRVFTDSDKPAMVLGVREFRPGANNVETIDFKLPSGKKWEFKDLPDPRMKSFQNL